MIKSNNLPVINSAHLAGHNLFVDLDRLISKKRRVTCSHFIDKNSKCPPVHSFVVALEESHKETEKVHYFQRYFGLPISTPNHLGKVVK